MQSAQNEHTVGDVASALYTIISLRPTVKEDQESATIGFWGPFFSRWWRAEGGVCGGRKGRKWSLFFRPLLLLCLMLGARLLLAIFINHQTSYWSNAFPQRQRHRLVHSKYIFTVCSFPSADCTWDLLLFFFCLYFIRSLLASGHKFSKMPLTSPWKISQAYFAVNYCGQESRPQCTCFITWWWLMVLFK